MKLLKSALLALLSTPTLFAATHFVSETGAGTLDGTSWGNAAAGSTLQTVINNAIAGDEIWVSCGTYLTSLTTDRSLAFALRNDITIYGSFNGTENNLSERILTCGPCTILSGDIGVAGSNTDNSYHVISNPVGLNNSAVLDGFVIEGARDDRGATMTEGLGGGIYNDGGYTGNFCNPTIRNCVIQNNFAQFGAGIFNSGHSGGEASPQIMNCIITENTAFIGGGGIDNFGLGGEASPTLTNCLVYFNIAIQRAGGMYCWAGNNGNASPLLVNCVFANNTATDGGGLVSDNENSPSGSNSGNSNPSLLNSVFWGNTVTGTGPQFFLIGTGTFSATYSDVDLTGQSTPHVMSGAGTGNLNAEPQFAAIANAKGLDACWFSADDGLQLLATSPLINAGNSVGAPGQDLFGVAYEGLPDMGVYEYITPISGLADSKLEKSSIHPNPTTGAVFFTFPDNKSHEIVIYTANGQVLKKAELVNKNTLDLSELANGMYLIKVDEGGFQKLLIE